MRIAISGASGLIGRGLLRGLKAEHEVVTLVRRSAGATEIAWDPAAGQLAADALEGFDAVVHLSGANISNGRFTASRKQANRDSRVQSTRLLAETLARLRKPPATLVCASAIGFYGPRDAAPVDETSGPGAGFLADVCTAWEAAADPARAAGLRVCHVRVGIVLTTEGGALKALLLPFRLGAGGRLGDGQQGMSWIDYDDILGLFGHCLTHADVRGPINGTAPRPVSNAVFAKTLGAVLHRPSLLPLPAAVVRGLFGEMGQALLLDGAYVLPRAAAASGYVFKYPELRAALEHQLRADTARPRG